MSGILFSIRGAILLLFNQASLLLMRNPSKLRSAKCSRSVFKKPAKYHVLLALQLAGHDWLAAGWGSIVQQGFEKKAAGVQKGDTSFAPYCIIWNLVHLTMLQDVQLHTSVLDS
jgi:hypothetical protein